jgi:YHS domain-containing protein
VLVTAATRTLATGLPDVRFVPLGVRRLRGVAEEVELFAALPAAAAAAATRRAVDPVCGMEIEPGQEAARLAYEGSERVFCSSACLQRFVAQPERYRVRPR